MLASLRWPRAALWCTQTVHLDFEPLNWTQNSLAQSSQTNSITRMTWADGASSTISSAYDNAPVNSLPIQLILALHEACNSPSIYTQNYTGLRTPACLTPSVTLNRHEWLPPQTTRSTQVYNLIISRTTIQPVNLYPLNSETICNNSFYRKLLRHQASYNNSARPTICRVIIQCLF